MPYTTVSGGFEQASRLGHTEVVVRALAERSSFYVLAEHLHDLAWLQLKVRSKSDLPPGRRRPAAAVCAEDAEDHQVLPLLYLHGLSSGDFVSALGQFLSSSAGLSAVGSAWLDALGLPQPHAEKVLSLRQLSNELSAEITMLSDVIGDLLAGDRGYQVIQQLPGIGPVLAAAIIAKIGDVTRLRSAAQLCSWAG